MRCAAAILSLTIIAAAAVGRPAHADPYRWCGLYDAGSAVATNCYFMTLQQCRAAMFGNGGFCTPNTFYDGRPVWTPGERQPIGRVRPPR